MSHSYIILVLDLVLREESSRVNTIHKGKEDWNNRLEILEPDHRYNLAA